MSHSQDTSNRVDPIEKKIIAAALLISGAHLGLIAYAAIKLGIGVPTCVTNVKSFEAGSFIDHGNHRYEVHVLAKMWGFEPSKLRLPTGSTVDFYLTSKDVTHGFHIDGTNVNLMAEPFVVNQAQARFVRPGTYSIVCHEYCGAGHQAMNALIDVSDSIQEASAEGLPAAAPSSGKAILTSAEIPAAVHPGRKIMEAKGCVACHNVDGSAGVGPGFKGLWGQRVEFTDGTSTAVDAAYIRESITEPQKKIVKGFGPVMPKLPVTDAEIEEVTEYLKTLK